jgi:hypothetical protein
MRTYRGPRIDTTILGAASLLALAMAGVGATPTQHIRTAPAPASVAEDGAAAYAGVWMSADDAVRLDLSIDLTYARSIVGRKATAVGTYTVDGDTLRLRDSSSGLRTTVTSVGGQLDMAGYRLSRI